jgi:hypothetical protein
MIGRKLLGIIGAAALCWGVVIVATVMLVGCGSSTSSLPVVDPTTASTPLQTVAALKADLLDVELAAAAILPDVSDAGTKTTIVQAITAAHNAVDAAETAAESGGSTAATTLAAAEAAITSAQADVAGVSTPAATTPTTSTGTSP